MSERRLVHCVALPERYIDPIARSLIFTAHDLETRWKLIDRAEAEYNVGNLEGAAMLFHAEMYLRDRLAYEMEPPPGKYAIRFPVDEEEACAPEQAGGGAARGEGE